MVDGDPPPLPLLHTLVLGFQRKKVVYSPIIIFCLARNPIFLMNTTDNHLLSFVKCKLTDGDLLTTAVRFVLGGGIRTLSRLYCF